MPQATLPRKQVGRTPVPKTCYHQGVGLSFLPRRFIKVLPALPHIKTVFNSYQQLLPQIHITQPGLWDPAHTGSGWWREPSGLCLSERTVLCSHSSFSKPQEAASGSGG